jgi:peptide chain release factor 1
MADENASLFSKLKEFDVRFIEIENELMDPEVACNIDLSIKLSKEQGKLRPLVEKYREYDKAQTGLEDAKLMLEDPDIDPDFAELAKAEVEELTETVAKVVEDIKETLVMSDDASIGSIIIEIRPGTGGDEAGLFARDLATMYTGTPKRRSGKLKCSRLAPLRWAGFAKRS